MEHKEYQKQLINKYNILILIDKKHTSKLKTIIKYIICILICYPLFLLLHESFHILSSIIMNIPIEDFIMKVVDGVLVFVLYYDNNYNLPIWDETTLLYAGSLGIIIIGIIFLILSFIIRRRILFVLGIFAIGEELFYLSYSALFYYGDMFYIFELWNTLQPIYCITMGILILFVFLVILGLCIKNRKKINNRLRSKEIEKLTEKNKKYLKIEVK